MATTALALVEEAVNPFNGPNAPENESPQKLDAIVAVVSMSIGDSETAISNKPEKEDSISEPNGISTTPEDSLPNNQEEKAKDSNPGMLTDGEKTDESINPRPNTPEVSPGSSLGEVQNEEVKPFKPKWIHGVKKFDYEQFKNRFNEKADIYAIEVLIASANLDDDIRREQSKRESEDTKDSKNKKAQSTDGSKNTDSSGKSEDGWTQRVRIRSEAVLTQLCELGVEPGVDELPRTFIRPFRVLIHYQPQMKEALNTLEAQWAEAERLDSLDAGDKARGSETTPTVTGGSDIREADGPVSEEASDHASKKSVEPDESKGENVELAGKGVGALRDMRCYIKFIDDEIMPLYTRFDGMSRSKVRFTDLWLLFRTGEILFVPPSPEITTTHPTNRLQRRAVLDSKDAVTSVPYSMYQSVWRLYTMNNPVDRYKPRAVKKGQMHWREDDDGEVTVESFRLFAYYIDHDGVGYGAVKCGFVIRPYDGEKDIRALPCHPIRYAENHLQLTQDLKKQGEKFQSYLQLKHLSYNGWTLTANPKGDPIDDTKGKKIRNPEYVESHVIVDFVETFQTYPSWKPEYHRPSLYDTDEWTSEIDDFGIKQWNDRDRTQEISDTEEFVQVSDPIEMLERIDAVEKDTFFSQLSTSEQGKTITRLEDDDLMLLPKRLFAYVLRERKFVLVSINFLNPIQKQEDIFAKLKISSTYKEIVKGLASSHFLKKDMEKRYASVSGDALSQDLIQGKGKGLIILLHGVPGVGKTATAEAVALENQKPLFIITSGDIGLTPMDVESNLGEIFRLAHLWDCVLLLDEADVFLSQRSRLDLKRNALVSVFLRVLEYYNGILFLTTNRVGTLDEAFKSRIHMSLYYPPLKRPQTIEIFKMNIQRLKDIEEQQSKLTKEPALIVQGKKILSFAEQHFDGNSRYSGRWNGRQIRNAFQIAASLAYHEERLAHTERLKKNPKAQAEAPILDENQFRKVEETTRAFDNYMEETKGWNDAEMAHLLSERADYVEQKKSMRIIETTNASRVDEPSSTTSARYGQSPSQMFSRVEGSAQQRRRPRYSDHQSPTPAYSRQKAGDRSVSARKSQQEQTRPSQNAQTPPVNRRHQQGYSSAGYRNQRHDGDGGNGFYGIEEDFTEEFDNFPNENPDEYRQEVCIDSEDDGSQY